MVLLYIALAGAVGSVSRYLMGRGVQGALHLEFPVGTLAVNVLGCLLIGVFARAFMNMQTDATLRATLMVGFCGGFTTFSSFSYETYGLIIGGEWGKAAAYVLLSVTVCLGATVAGYAVAKAITA